jgi:glutamate synthase domain-containing protein 3
MSGGIAYVYDPDKVFPGRCNKQLVDLERVATGDDEDTVLTLLRNHARLTQSAVAQAILDSWKTTRVDFVKVMPKDYKKVLAAIETAKRTGIPEDQAIMEASNG